MELRDHPAMTHRRGAKTWRPHWIAVTRKKSEWPTGEVGVLQQVWLHGELDNCLFLFIENHGGFYTGAMYFDNPSFCNQLYNLLMAKRGRSIKEIGDLDLSHTL